MRTLTARSRFSDSGRILMTMPVSEPPERPLGDISVPDDARALEGDRWAYYDELNQRGDLPHAPGGPDSHDEPGRWRDGSPWLGQHGSRTMPLLFCVTGIALMLGVLLLALVPRDDAPTQTVALASSTAAVGSVGGLLPQARVTLNDQPRSLRDLRPAVIALIGNSGCTNCTDAVAAAASTSEANGVRFMLSTEEPAGTKLRTFRLAAGIMAPALVVPPGVWDDFEPEGLTLIAVNPDGTVSAVVRNAQMQAGLATSLQQALNTAG